MPNLSIREDTTELILDCNREGKKLNLKDEKMKESGDSGNL